MINFFKDLKDPRVERSKEHLLSDIIGLTICAVISGSNTWNEIEEYGNQKIDFLKRFLQLKEGIPSHDTINRVFAAIDCKALHQCFLDWIQSIATITEGRIVSIDGKRLCNAGEDGKKSFIHLVNAWCSQNNMVIGQEKTEEKSNEITAIPKLIEMLLLEGAIVTIDAMGCQTAIAQKIVDAGATYVLAVKENQGHLLDDIKEAFEQTPKAIQHTTTEKAHGRIEIRTSSIIEDMDWISKKENWKNIHTIVKIETKRTNLQTNVIQTEQRFYISSLKSTAEHFNQITRGHWQVENKLHWQLDVTFKEDLSTKQAGNAAENFAIITKVALNLLNNNKSKKASLNTKRLICAWNEDFLYETIFKKN